MKNPRQMPVVISVPKRQQITPSRTIQHLAVTLTYLDQLYGGERETVLKNVCFYYGYTLAPKP